MEFYQFNQVVFTLICLKFPDYLARQNAQPLTEDTCVVQVWQQATIREET